MKVLAIVLVALAIGALVLGIKRARNLRRGDKPVVYRRKSNIGTIVVVIVLLLLAFWAWPSDADADEGIEEIPSEMTDEEREADEDAVRNAEACTEGIDDSEDYFGAAGKVHPNATGEPAEVESLSDFYNLVLGDPGRACHSVVQTVYHGAGIDPTSSLGEILKQGETAPNYRDWVSLVDGNAELREEVIVRIDESFSNGVETERVRVKPGSGYNYALVLVEEDGDVFPANAELELPEEGVEAVRVYHVKGDNIRDARHIVFEPERGWYLLTAPIEGLPSAEKVNLGEADEEEEESEAPDDSTSTTEQQDDQQQQGRDEDRDQQDQESQQGHQGGTPSPNPSGPNGPGDGDNCGGSCGEEGQGGDGGDDCVNGCPGNGGDDGDKCKDKEKDCPGKPPSTTSPPTTSPPTTRPPTTTTPPTTTKPPSTTTTTVPKTSTTTTTVPKTTTTTTTTTTTPPTTTKPPKGPDPGCDVPSFCD